jgi:hypothetical protein
VLGEAKPKRFGLDVAGRRGGHRWLRLRPGASASPCGGQRPDDLTRLVELCGARAAIPAAGGAMGCIMSAATFGAEL